MAGFDGLTLRSCFVGLMLRVGGRPLPPVCCRTSGSPPPIPVNWRAIVVVPVVCAATLGNGLDPNPEGSGMTGDERVGEDCGERRDALRRSCNAPLGCLLLAPATKHAPCHFVFCGPATTPRSIGDTFLWHPGHEMEPPNRGKDVCVDGAVRGWLSYRLEDAGGVDLTFCRDGGGVECEARCEKISRLSGSG
ncbi:hypothetical protein BD626DRAFT_485672 [Schizophyllum amplum]|uniref:Uncharacterized protein n=1 Tax=Schizophyllum amplum TaxID=97359 RepID=A0A550CLN7_9AGAR|nr:hypothetical protein BD626DRAFT_485672 [Auriculariopsis ampla]